MSDTSTADSFMRIMGAQLAERAWRDIYEFASPEAKRALADSCLKLLPDLMRYANANEVAMGTPEVKEAISKLAGQVVGQIQKLDPGELAKEIGDRITVEVKSQIEREVRKNISIRSW